MKMLKYWRRGGGCHRIGPREKRRRRTRLTKRSAVKTIRGTSSSPYKSLVEKKGRLPRKEKRKCSGEKGNSVESKKGKRLYVGGNQCSSITIEGKRENEPPNGSSKKIETHRSRVKGGRARSPDARFKVGERTDATFRKKARDRY